MKICNSIFIKYVLVILFMITVDITYAQSIIYSPPQEEAWISLQAKLKNKIEVDIMSLIPFNSSGKWGYSDTTGNIIIKPQFNHASFFFEFNSDSISWYQSLVGTGGGKNYYSISRGFVIPRKYGSVFQYENIYEGRLIIDYIQIVRTKDLKYNIWTFKNGIVSKRDFKEFSSLAYEFGIIAFRNKRSKKWQIYNRDTRIIEKSNLTDFYKLYEKNEKGHNSKVLLASSTNGDIYSSINEFATLTKIDTSLLHLFHLSSSTVEFVEMEDRGTHFSKERIYKYDFKRLNIESRIKIRITSGDASFDNKYNEFKIVQENGNVGLSTLSDSLIFPPVYDSIGINFYSPRIMIYKNGKTGMFTFSPYPLFLEPIYDEVEYYDTKIINGNRKIFYRIDLNGNKGLIDESGTKFFKNL